MRLQRAFDLYGRNILTAPSNDIFRTVDEEKRAVIALPDDVSRMEPTAGPGLLRRRLVLVVSREEAAPRRVTLAPDQQLPRDARRGVVPCIIDDAAGQPRRRPAEAALPNVARLLVGGDPGTRSGFGHRPRLDQWHAESLLECRMVTRIHACAK